MLNNQHVLKIKGLTDNQDVRCEKVWAKLTNQFSALHAGLKGSVCRLAHRPVVVATAVFELQFSSNIY